MVTIIIYCVY